jgi:hypothetical protein
MLRAKTNTIRIVDEFPEPLFKIPVKKGAENTRKHRTLRDPDRLPIVVFTDLNRKTLSYFGVA